MANSPVLELRLVATVDDFDEALRFYRDVLGLRELHSVRSPDGKVAILEAGRATLEIADARTAEFIDGIEVGRRVAGQFRVAFEVNDVEGMTRQLEKSGAVVLGEPRLTAFGSINARLDAPAGLQLTLFQREDD
jgi:catechol 2,3-dioxygenase-like lactoylglutathione lyase family enzyme